MLTINRNKNGDELTVSLEGKRTSKTAPELESEIEKMPRDVKTLILDFEGLEYLTSAGRRVLLTTQQKMEEAGSVMKLRHINSAIMSVFNSTGFIDVLTIEEESKE